MFFPSTSSSSTSSTSFPSSNDKNPIPQSNHHHPPRSRAHSTLALPTIASASVHVRYLYLAGRYRDLSEEHGLGIVGKPGGLLDQGEEDSRDKDKEDQNPQLLNTNSLGVVKGSIRTTESGFSSARSNKRGSIRLNEIFLGANAINNTNNNTSRVSNSVSASASKFHAPHGARHGSLRDYAQQRLKIQEKIEGRIRRATDTKRLEWEAQAALLASSHSLALLLLTRAGVLGSNSASLQLASLYSSGVVRGTSPSVVLVHRDPIRAISWLIRSGRLLRLQVEAAEQEKDNMRRDAANANKRGVGHRRSLSGQSQRAGLTPTLQTSEAVSKRMASCPFSLMSTKSLEDPLALLSVLVRALRTNQTQLSNGDIESVELINVKDEGNKGIKTTLDGERLRNDFADDLGEKGELWQEVRDLVAWMESRLPSEQIPQNSSTRASHAVSGASLSQAQMRAEYFQEFHQPSSVTGGTAAVLPLASTKHNADTAQAFDSSETALHFGPDDVDEMLGVASSLREVRVHLCFLNVLVGIRDFSLAISSNRAAQEEGPSQTLMLKLENLISLLEQVPRCSNSDQTLPYSIAFKSHQMETSSKSSLTLVSLSKQTTPMIKDVLSFLRALISPHSENADDKDSRGRMKDRLTEISELMEGSLAEIAVPSVTSNVISSGSELQNTLSSSQSNKRIKPNASADISEMKFRRRKSLEDLAPMDVDSTQQLNEAQRPSLLSFPSSTSALNLPQTKIDSVIAPGEAPVLNRPSGRTLSSVSQLRVAMPSSSAMNLNKQSTESFQGLLSPADSLMSGKNGYGFPSTSTSGKGKAKDQSWNALGLGPGSAARVRRPSSVVSDSPSLLFPSQQEQDQDIKVKDAENRSADSLSQNRDGDRMQRSDSMHSNSSLWTGSVSRRRKEPGSDSLNLTARRRVTSLYGEPSIAVGKERSPMFVTSDSMDPSYLEADSDNLSRSSSSQYLNSSAQFDPTRSLRELNASRRRGSVASNSSTNSFSNFSSNLPFFGNSSSNACPSPMRSLSSKTSLSSLNVNDHGFSHQMSGSAALGRQAVDSLRKLRGQLPTSPSTSSFSRNQESGPYHTGEQFDSNSLYQPRKRTTSSASMPAHLLNETSRPNIPIIGTATGNGGPNLRRTPSSSSNHSQLGGTSRIPSLRPRPPSMLSPSLSFLQTSVSPPEESPSAKPAKLSSGSISRNGTLNPSSPISPTSPNSSTSALGTLRKIGLEAQAKKRSPLPEDMSSPELLSPGEPSKTATEAKGRGDEVNRRKPSGNANSNATRSFMGIDPTKANSLYGSLSNPSSNNPTPTHPRSPLSPSPSGTLSGTRSPLSDYSESARLGYDSRGKSKAVDSDQLDLVLARAEERSRLKTDSFCDECGTLVVNAPISKSGLKFCGRECRIQSKEREKEKRRELERRKEVKDKEARENEPSEKKEESTEISAPEAAAPAH